MLALKFFNPNKREDSAELLEVPNQKQSSFKKVRPLAKLDIPKEIIFEVPQKMETSQSLKQKPEELYAIKDAKYDQNNDFKSSPYFP